MTTRGAIVACVNGTRRRGLLERKIVVLTGPIAAGKSTLAEQLSRRVPSTLSLSTRDLMRARLGAGVTGRSRAELQRAGDELDRATGGRWVTEGVRARLGAESGDRFVVVDSARTLEQIERLRDVFGGRVVHVHVSAPDAELERRFSARDNQEVSEPRTYADARSNATERAVDNLAREADLVLDTRRCDAEDVCERLLGALGFYGRGVVRLVDVLIGGQYGSEGKGHISSYLANEYKILVRVGGPNAGHKVWRPEGPVTFHHLPSGTATSTAKLVLGPGAVLGLEKLLSEIERARVSPDRLSIDPQAVIIESADLERESDLEDSIGSTRQGVGAATARKVMRGGAVQLARDIPEIQPYVTETRPILERAFAASERVFVEGTQGTELSLHHGEYPFVTSRDTTASGCLAEAGIAPGRVRRVILVCRTYPIRVQGNSGPMGRASKEIDWEVVAARSGIPAAELELREKTSTTGRRRRVAEFDWVSIRKAVTLNGPTDIALTFTDYLSITNRTARTIDQLDPEARRLIDEIERVTSVPVSLVSTRFHARGIVDRRSW